MALSLPIFRRRPAHPEDQTPNAPTFNASLLIICLLLLGATGFLFIHLLFPAVLGR